MARVVQIVLTNRKAILSCPGTLLEEINEFLKYRHPGWEYTAAAKFRGWDGFIHLMQGSRVGAGVFLALREKIEKEFSVKFEVDDNRVLPSFCDGVVDTKARPYQLDCLEKMLLASYTGGLILNATGCVVGDTLIDCPRDLEKYPLGIPIKDLVGKTPWVYCWDDKNRRIALSQTSRVWKSGKKVSVYKVTFKVRGFKSRFGNRKVEPIDYIVATADHPFLLYSQNPKKRTNAGHDFVSAGYVQLKDLKVGDRVMALYRSLGMEKGYSYLHLNNGISLPEHRFIASEVYGEHGDGWHAHHKNERGLDNRVGNVRWKTHSDHARYHAIRRNKDGSFIGWRKTGVHPRGMAGKRQTEHQKEAVRRYWKSRREQNNHIVKDVKFLGYQDVYNMTVPKNQNFVANGVVTHNTGKTFSTGLYLKRLKGPALFLVDELTLLKQAINELRSVLQEDIGEIGNSIFRPRRVTVATIQTIHKHRFDQSYVPWTRTLEVIIIDELHLALNRRNFQTIAAIQPPVIFGLTATLELKKKNVAYRAYDLCGPVVFEYPLEKGVAEGFLSKGVAVSVQVEQDIKAERIRGNPRWAWVREKYKQQYHELYREIIVEGKKRNRVILDLLKTTYKQGKHIVVLLNRVQHLKNLSKSLNGTPHQLVFGEVHVRERVAAQKRMEESKLRVILTNVVFKKGINIKKIDVIIDGAGMKSKNDAVQKYGRGVRLADGKDGLLYFDIADVGNRFEKASSSRASALKRAKIPVYKVSSELGAKEIIRLAEKKLKKELEASTLVEKETGNNVQSDANRESD